MSFGDQEEKRCAAATHQEGAGLELAKRELLNDGDQKQPHIALEDLLARYNSLTIFEFAQLVALWATRKT